MPPPPQITEEPEEEDWLVTYADAITLLMAFFVMLVSFSKIDLATFDAVMAGIKNEIGMGKSTGQSTPQQIKAAIESASFEMSMEQVVDVYKDPSGIVIEMASTSFFKPGTAQITKFGIPLIKSWAKILTEDKFKYFFVTVEGHTDDDPINTKQFPSNWELSAARAAAVVRLLQSETVHKFQLKVAGFGDSHPKVPNRDASGKAIKTNQAKNRRIIVRLVQMLNVEKSQFDDVLLEERLAREELKRRQDRAKKEAALKAAQQAAQQAAPASNQPAPASNQPAPAPTTNQPAPAPNGASAPAPQAQ